jgi:hypothetical protein
MWIQIKPLFWLLLIISDPAVNFRVSQGIKLEVSQSRYAVNTFMDTRIRYKTDSNEEVPNIVKY